MRKRGHTASHSSSLGCWVSEPQLKPPLILAAFLDVLKCPSSGQGGENQNCKDHLSCLFTGLSGNGYPRVSRRVEGVGQAI